MAGVLITAYFRERGVKARLSPGNWRVLECVVNIPVPIKISVLKTV